MTALEQQRLFFALEPDADTRRRLDALASDLYNECDDGYASKVVCGNLHLTLSFLGWVDQQVAHDLSAWLEAFAAPSFTLTLDRIGHFGNADVVWAGPSTIPPALTDLVSAVKARAGEAGISTETGRPYSPHVSLVRKVPKAVSRTISRPIIWSVGQCVLMRAVDTADGAIYETAARSRRN